MSLLLHESFNCLTCVHYSFSTSAEDCFDLVGEVLFTLVTNVEVKISALRLEEMIRWRKPLFEKTEHDVIFSFANFYSLLSWLRKYCYICIHNIARFARLHGFFISAMNVYRYENSTLKYYFICSFKWKLLWINFFIFNFWIDNFESCICQSF